MEEDVKKYRDRLPSATLDEQIEYLEEKLEIIQVCVYGYGNEPVGDCRPLFVCLFVCVCVCVCVCTGPVQWVHSKEKRKELETTTQRCTQTNSSTKTKKFRYTLHIHTVRR